MSPCCLAAAAAAAALTALIVAALTAFVLVTDGFGLGVLLSTLLAASLQAARWIGPCPRLLYALSALLAIRAALLLATTRRPLVAAVFGRVRSRIARALPRPTAIPRPMLGRRRRASRHSCCHDEGENGSAPSPLSAAAGIPCC